MEKSPYEDYSSFNLDEMTESECLSEFRFRKRDIPILADVLGIPETIWCEQGSTCDGLEDLCMVLRRLSFPCRYADIISRFAKPVPVISRELKMETFSGRRRPDWQRKPGTEAAVASRQNSNIKMAVNSEGRRLRRIPERKMWLHIKN